jgi:hypothetical protein
MATLQAIAEALGVIEGDPVRAELMKLYDAKIERTLIGRGILRKKPALEEVLLKVNRA